MAKLRDLDPSPAEPAPRVASIDALRGTLLFVLVGAGFGLLSERMLNQAQWGWITSQFAHRPWGNGCSLWDLLLPGMLFVVGLAMPFSYANRLAREQAWPRQFLHALLRTGALILLGIYLDSFNANRLVLDLRGCLQTIGLAYFLAFLVLPLGMAVHGVVVGFLLIGHTAAHVIYAVASGHELWSRTQNLGVAIDQMGRLPAHPQDLVTCNVLWATAVVAVGVLVADLIRSSWTPGVKVIVLATFSFFAILFGWALSGGGGWVDVAWHPVIPMIPRIGTFTFVLTALGWIVLVFAYFYTMMEGLGWESWALPLAVLGRNSLFLFIASTVFREPIARSARLLVPESPALMARLQPLLVDLLVVLVFWLVCLWLYRRRIFIKM